MLSELIEALQIFLKYGDVQFPTHCEHDELTVCVDPRVVSDEDKKKLLSLSFFEDDDHFTSYRYGSA